MSNFSDFDLKKVSNIFNGKYFTVRINKGGNIQLDVKDVSLFNKSDNYNWNKRSYVFYKPSYRGGRIIIRSLNYGSDCHNNSIYPLNMTYKSRHTDKVDYGMGPEYTYNIKYSTFDNIDDAIVYFVEYLNIYKNILV